MSQRRLLLGGWVGLFFFLSAPSALAAGPLFPEPWHFVRRVVDPLSGTTTTVDEYCAGSQVVALSGDRVVITDYEKGQLTEIDRAAGTWSVTTFEQIAEASRMTPRSEKAWTTARRGMRPASHSTRQLDVVSLESDDASLEVGFDTSVTLPRRAVEVLIGAAWPNVPRGETEAILSAATIRPTAFRPASDSATEEALCALPSEQKLTLRSGGHSVVVETSIVAVSRERVPPDAALIPPNARRVESRHVTLARELRSLDLAPVRSSSEQP